MLTDAEYTAAQSLSVLTVAGVRRRPGVALEEVLMDEVMAVHPEAYGADSPSQRQRWRAELRWAWTILSTRCYSPRTGGAL